MSLMLKNTQIYCKKLNISDGNIEYVSWLSDSSINKYLENRFSKHTVETVQNFIKSCNNNPNIHLFGVFDNTTQEHIGNIKLGPIDANHSVADIGLLIGNSKYWGRGIATEAITLIVSFAFDSLNLHKVTASMYEKNLGSYKAFINAGFFDEGRRIKHYKVNGQYQDKLLVGKLNENDI